MANTARSKRAAVSRNRQRNRGSNVKPAASVQAADVGVRSANRTELEQRAGELCTQLGSLLGRVEQSPNQRLNVHDIRAMSICAVKVYEKLRGCQLVPREYKPGSWRIVRGSGTDTILATVENGNWGRSIMLELAGVLQKTLRRSDRLELRLLDPVGRVRSRLEVDALEGDMLEL